ncbi:zinc finger, CCHC-type containing protein [Tanacetum coccineum]|uniref:Zinc finger, CCHC-type containing protein n=1 Tax=Tanacetum coccineum TaxID=301880 RepID=A0ABQ5B6E7_9ASTR
MGNSLYIKDDDDVSYEGEVIPEQFVKHFEKFLGKVDQVVNVDDGLFKSTLNSEEANNMICDVTYREIKEAMFDIESNKASGPDGYTSEFFKKAWDVVGNEVCLAIKEFFKNGKLLGEVNFTLIALIPKVSTPSKVSEFRPITSCNVIYKCISKILTNRIKRGLDKIVHINQSACIPGRHIQDNILIAQELLRGYNRKNDLKRCAMQIDIQKDYDTNIEESSEYGYHFGCKELKLSHMCFADDLLILCKGNKGSIKNAGDSTKGKARVALKVIIEDQNSLWAKWVNIVKLKNKSIWDVSVDKSDSWGWKTMMTIRDEIRDHVWSDIGNGRKTYVWYDKWCIDGPLSTIISKRNIYEAKLKDDAKVVDMVNDGQWVWPDGWKEIYPILRNLDRTVNLTNKEDKVLWITNAGHKLCFTTKQAWEDLRLNWPIVNWRHVVWFSQLIPRQAFILWMAIRDKLLTQEKVEKGQNSGVLKCGFCNHRVDSLYHLFFQCELPKKLWSEMLKLTYKMEKLFKLQDVVDALAGKSEKKSIGIVVNKLTLNATIYFIWQERNFRMFKCESRNEDVIIKTIYDSVRSKLMSVRVKKSLRADIIAKKWGLQWVFAANIYGDHDVSCAGIVGIEHRHNIMRDTLVDMCFRSAGKEVDIGLGRGRGKPLHPADMLFYSWDGGLDVCVDLTSSSPLTQSGMIGFAPGRAVIEAAQRKRVKYEAKCVDIGYGFLPFSFSSFGELEKDAVNLLKRIRRFSMTQDIGARATIHIFNRIVFAIARGVGAQIVSQFPTNFL